jgi:hypothetical protein
MKLHNFGFAAIAALLATGHAVAADGARAPAWAVPAMEILVVTAKRPTASPVAENTEPHARADLAGFAALTIAPAVQPRVEADVDLPESAALDVAPPRIDLAVEDIEVRIL